LKSEGLCTSMTKKTYLLEVSEEYFEDTGKTADSFLYNSFDEEFPNFTSDLTDEQILYIKLKYGHFVRLIEIK